MDLRPLDDTTFAAPMIDPSDMPALAEAGVTTVICNRPDAEVPPSHRTAAMQSAAEAAGMTYVFNPIAGMALTVDAVEEQADAIDGADGKVVAYCASGTRSTILWALAQAGRRSADDILAATAAAGYPLDGLRNQIEQLEARA
ncbi:TIGR01244 family sulfur transferase [Jannaschia donghaensis]|uniref:Beta-lactamase hydrolase-like protein n=1 Tax=Jannaschia donghaensis TaxID=420998 RepID=A0A0M6YMF5_9RHOB|nr:TIGR01244 family sulfur transferase [Jannaschia donghaensis]CTQ51120.1 Beta-lactamase hydrolase-like protein [Jannaschia donghaensis]